MLRSSWLRSQEYNQQLLELKAVELSEYRFRIQMYGQLTDRVFIYSAIWTKQLK